MTTNQISTQIATLQKTLKTTTNKTLKDTLKKKIERLKGDLQNSGKTTKQLANELLKGKNKVNNMNAFEFKETVRKLAQKPEYTFLKSMGKSEIKDDLKRYAKPVGWRFKGRGNYEKPTKTDIKNKNNVYWENRPNRTDVVFPAKLETGGALGTGGSSDWGANDGGTFSTKMDGFESKFAKGGKTKKEIIRDFEYEMRPDQIEMVSKNIAYDMPNHTKPDSNGKFSAEQVQKAFKYIPDLKYVKNKSNIQTIINKVLSIVNESNGFKYETGGALGTGGSSDWGANDGGTFSTKMDGFESKFAKGGKTKKEPKIIRGFLDDEGFEYGNGGEIGKNLKAIANKYESNEDENMHSENVVLLAKHFGTDLDLKEANEILAKHIKEGFLSSENGNKRNALYNKLISKARNEMLSNGIKFETGGALGTGGSSDWGANDGGTFSTKMDGFESKFAKGGKTKKEPKIIRGFLDDEGFEYGNGGGVEDLNSLSINELKSMLNDAEVNWKKDNGDKYKAINKAIGDKLQEKYATKKALSLNPKYAKLSIHQLYLKLNDAEINWRKDNGAEYKEIEKEINSRLS